MGKKTVFVIGAGASKEAGLPTGEGLKPLIVQLLDMQLDHGGTYINGGDDLIKMALRTHVRESSDINGITPYIGASKHIHDNLKQEYSIDNFIDKNRNNKEVALCGKLAIVRAILNAEKNSLLYFNNIFNINFDQLDNTWYNPFFNFITKRCSTIDEIKERMQSYTLIIFNYDRCIEHFLYYKLQKLYRISEDDAKEIVKDMNIFHPYGILGTLPWIDKKGAIDFGGEPNATQLLKLASNIRTFTEGTDPKSSEILRIKKHIDEANQLGFLGFAFDNLNMQLITPEYDQNKKTPTVKCFATAYNRSESDREVIESQIKDLYKFREFEPYVRVKKLTCYEFFDEYGKSLDS